MRRQTLTQACEPVLFYLATFRRNAATTGLSLQALQNALRAELDTSRSSCERDSRIAPLMERAFPALVYAADQVVLTSLWPSRTQWAMSLLETSYFNTARGGEEFFRFVEEVKRDTGDAAVEISELLFHCMAMGFQGSLRNERLELEARRRELFDKARLGAAAQVSDGYERHLTPDAYGRNSAMPRKTLPTTSTLRLVAAGLIALGLSWALGYFVNQAEVSDDLEQLNSINGKLESKVSDQ